MSGKQVMIKDVVESEGVLQFTLFDIPMCYANALRRTVLSGVPVCVIRSENEAVNQCHFEVNTTRFHNEILKQRLSCIPIHMKDMEVLPGKYALEVDMQNDSDEIMYVTTEHFRIKNKETGNYTTKEQTREIFPPDPMTHDYIQFCRLRPKISETIPGENIKFTADFSVSTAKENSMFNVVSKCTYQMTPDREAAEKEWKKREGELRKKLTSITEDEIEFEKRNFQLLDAERYYMPNSYDFTIQSIGIYSNPEVVKKALTVLQNKLVDTIQLVANDDIAIRKSETTMENCYDVILENEDYTLGKIVEFVLYERYYMKDKTLSFCGFKKMHPHFTESVLRLAFVEPTEKDQIRYVLKEACMEGEQRVKQIFGLF
jgi:DNA-directed RNA polymerase alpha subunit